MDMFFVGGSKLTLFWCTGRKLVVFRASFKINFEFVMEMSCISV